MDKIDDNNPNPFFGKIINYNDNDPRYGFTIKDSYEYNESINPIGLNRSCNDKCNFLKEIEAKYPPITRCWGERYENCVDINTVHDIKCERCKDNTYCPDGPTILINASISNETRSRISDKKDIDKHFKPRVLNNRTFYDKSRINKYDINRAEKFEQDYRKSSFSISAWVERLVLCIILLIIILFVISGS